MKQAILLDSRDLASLKEGLPLTIHVGDSSIELTYRATTITPENSWTCPDCSKVFAVVSKGGHIKWHQRNARMWTCPKCKFKCKSQGKGAHMVMHKRNGNGK